MSMENVVAVQIPPELLEELVTKATEIQTALEPYLIALSPQQRKELPKMGDGTQPFVEKCLDYAKSDPQFMPPFTKVADLEIDFRAARDLNRIFRPLEQVTSNLNDTIVMSGSEAFVASLSYYSSVKLGARMNAKGAKVIADDLKKRFEGQGKVAKPTNGTPA